MKESANNKDNITDRVLNSEYAHINARRKEILDTSQTYQLLYKSDTPALQDILDYAFTAKLGREKPELLENFRSQVTNEDIPMMSNSFSKALARMQSQGLAPEVAFELQLAGQESPEWKQFFYPEFGTPDLSDQAHIEAQRFSYEMQVQSLDVQLSTSELEKTAERLRDTLAQDKLEFQELANHFSIELANNPKSARARLLGGQLEYGLHTQRYETMLAAASLLDPTALDNTKKLQETAHTWDQGFKDAGLEATSDYAISLPNEWKTVMEGVKPSMAKGVLGYAYNDNYALFRPDMEKLIDEMELDYPLVDHTLIHELIHLNQKATLTRTEAVEQSKDEPYGMRELVEGVTECKALEVLETKYGSEIHQEYQDKYPGVQYTAYQAMAQTIIEALPENERDERIKELFQVEWYSWQNDDNLKTLDINTGMAQEMVAPVHTLSNALLKAANGQPTKEQMREFVYLPYKEMLQEFKQELQVKQQAKKNPGPLAQRLQELKTLAISDEEFYSQEPTANDLQELEQELARPLPVSPELDAEL